MQRSIWSRILRRWLFRAPQPGRTAGKGRSSGRRSRVQPRLENLEDRTLLSNTYTVDMLGDAGKADPNDPLKGDIRYCVNQADLQANAGSTIQFDSTVFPAGKGTTIQLNHGELELDDNMTIQGPGASTVTLSGTDGQGGASRVFNITSNRATVTIADVTIANGNAAVYYTSIAGNQGGDIFNGGNLTLTNDIVTNGFSSGFVGGPNGRGGAIFNAEGQNGTAGATLVLNNTVVENSEAFGTGALGGGVFNDVGATLTLEGGSVVQDNKAIGEFVGSVGAGGGLYNKATLNIGLDGSTIVIQDNLAKGGASGPGYGGGVYNSGAFNLQNAQFLGNQAIGGNGDPGVSPPGTNGTPGLPGSNGGNGQGGGIYNGIGALALTIANTQFGTDSNGLGNEALGGSGGKGGNGAPGHAAGVGIPGGHGGTGGNGGTAQGGAVFNVGGPLTVNSSTFTDSEAIGGNGGNSGFGGTGGNSTAAGTQGAHGGDSLAAGNAGGAEGGAVFNSQSNLVFQASTLSGSRALGGQGGSGGVGGIGGAGGNASSKAAGGTGGSGGIGGRAGAGGAALGGGFYNLTGSVNVVKTTFAADSSGIGNEAVGGAGGTGGVAGNGGVGGNNSNGVPGGPGGAGGVGGRGGDGGSAQGGAGAAIQGGTVTLTTDTFTSSLVESGAGGGGGNGGNGGASGTSGPYGGAGGNSGDGGNALSDSGGAIAITAAVLNANSDTFGGATSNLGNQIIGGIGGAGGIGGTIGPLDGTSNYAVANPIGIVNPAGNGGAGGAGSPVNGGALSVNSTPLTTVNLLSNYEGLNFSQSSGGQSNGYVLPNTEGAAGTNNYIETVNQELALFTPKGAGTSIQTDTFADFWYHQGGLAQADPTSTLANPVIVWDDQIQRFIIGDQDVDPVTHISTLDIAISDSADPTSLTKADWSFFQVTTSETGYDAENSGNIGWNHDALVFTLNMVPVSSQQSGHVQIVSVSLSALESGTSLALGTNEFSNDFAGSNLRPTVMHDSVAGDPMWFVEDSADGKSISVVKMNNVLSTAPTLISASLAVNPYSAAVAPLQEDGTTINTNVDSRIMKSAEQNGLLVAAQTVSDSSGDEDNVQWYIIDVSSGTPKLQQQGDISGGPGVYDFNPGIDINASGDVGVSFLQATTAGQFLSMYVTGRTPDNAAGTMEVPVLVQKGQAIYNSSGVTASEGNLGSGINVDESDGSFYAVNEFADTEPGTNWATAIAHFLVNTPTPPSQTATLTASTFDMNSITSGGGGAGGQAGLFSLDGANLGINGQGGRGGLAQGGSISLTGTTEQDATLASDTIENTTVTAGAGGAGAINFTGAALRLIRNWGGHGSAGGAGGSVEGVDVADVNYNFADTSSTFTGGTGTAGAGGAGGGANITVPWSWHGGAGGAGGSVMGGGIYFSNTLASAITLDLSLSGGAVSNNTMKAGVGGAGGNAGASGSKNVTGGAGGAGGFAQGGGIYVLASGQSVNAASVTNVNLLGDHITAGAGGQGGAGYNAAGGTGGNAQGGAVFTTSLNSASGQNSSLNITGSTIAGAHVGGGDGGNAGSATTPNGGAGGNGGNAGAADGAGLFNGTDDTLNVLNSTFGGGSTDTNNPNANANMLTGGIGGRGGNAGTPAGVVSNNGGPGGAGGVIAGGNIFNAGVASLTNDTLVFGDAAATGLGGAGGSGAGNGGQPGKAGSNGVATGGGYFAASNSTNTLGNTVLALNTAATSDPDVSGAFSQGLLAPPAAPTLTTTSGGGSWAAQTAWVLLTYVNAQGETIGSQVVSVAVPANGTLTIDSPAAESSGLLAATGWYAYVGVGATQPANTALYRQQAAGSPTPIGTNLTLTGNPTITGANPPTKNTAAYDTFTSAGNNLLTNVGDSNGFNTGSGGADQIVTSAQLDLGPLLNNGGPTQTDALLPSSMAIDAGNNNLAQAAGLTTDQRGTGFARSDTGNTKVDVGAFEFNPPIIASTNGLSPSSVYQGSSDITLTITGSDFVSGATVSFGGHSLIPTSITSTQIVVTVPASLLVNPASVNVTVNIPDGSGVQGNTVASNAVVFTVAPTPFTLNNPGPQQNYDGESVDLTVTPASGFTASGFTAQGLPAGLSIDPNTGVISGILSSGDDKGSPYSVTVTATDSQGAQANVQFTWNVGSALSLNNPGNQSSDEGNAISLPITAPNGFKPSGYIVTGLPPGLTLDQSTGLIHGTIDARGAGTYTVMVTPANNGGQGGVTFQWVVADTTPPTLTNPGTINTAAGQTVTLAIPSVDADPGTFTATGLPSGLSIDPNTGVISGVIAAGTQGSYAVTITARDGSVQSASDSFLWIVAGSVSPPASPALPPGSVPPGTFNAPTYTTIASVSDQYQGILQLETVTVDVTNPSGYLVNEGVVAIQVDGRTVNAPVVNGVATATVATSLLDLSLWMDLLFSHPLTANYSDNSSVFASSGASTTLPPDLLEFFLYEIALQFQEQTLL